MIWAFLDNVVLQKEQILFYYWSTHHNGQQNCDPSFHLFYTPNSAKWSITNSVTDRLRSTSANENCSQTIAPFNWAWMLNLCVCVFRPSPLSKAWHRVFFHFVRVYLFPSLNLLSWPDPLKFGSVTQNPLILPTYQLCESGLTTFIQ